MRAFVYDTETNGLPDWKNPSDGPQQPHIVQMAARLVDVDTRKEIASLNLIIAPNGWSIPAELTEIHGIDETYARQVGVSEEKAIRLFHDLWAVSDFRVAHNESFDARIIRIAMKRFAGNWPEHVHNHWKEGPAECTQRLSTPILALPPTDKMVAKGFGHKLKTANLREAYRFFFGKDFEGAHSAMGDVDACQAVYFAIKGAESNGTTST